MAKQSSSNGSGTNRLAYARSTFDLPANGGIDRDRQAKRGELIELTADEFTHFEKLRLVTTPGSAPQPNVALRKIGGPDKDKRFLVYSGGGWFAGVVNPDGTWAHQERVQGREAMLAKLTPASSS